MTAPAATTYEVVIGIEVHAQLLTKSKMFCSCATDYHDSPPNSHVCPVCLAMPGVLPVINQQAVEYTIMAGLALNCTTAPSPKFDRKNYHYPDLMKGYQISQFDEPLSLNGYLDVVVDGQTRRIGVTRIHLEEDTARLLHREHAAGETYSLLDLNRSGVPLMECVSEPDIRTPEEARAYLVALRQIFRYLEVSSADMEKGSFRCDANISLRPWGQEAFGTKVEVKNMNSFRAVYKALQYEQRRQAEALRSGQRLHQETRGWVEDREVTVSQRSKEGSDDYRYFPDPDLPPLRIDRDRVEAIRAALPELPFARYTRFRADYGLGEFEANLLTEERGKADYYEAAVAALGRISGTAANEKTQKSVANWMVGEMARLLNEAGQGIGAVKISPAQLAGLVALIDSGTISNKLAKDVFESMYESGGDPTAIVAASGQTQISDSDELRGVVQRVVDEQPRAVEDYRAGKQEAVKFLMGQVMKATRGRANPRLVSEILRGILDG
ncbi:MAG: Asp-tRNA(Asn)/Glu-tRNA(Gln) amidotransferase subunit GatB [Chloroflexi bacterium]|nr:Asp-tRNA(Asn)/Glu-tRNA(Gln) amidotransferase subunit GatB [Chloroflexota bacterium]